MSTAFLKQFENRICVTNRDGTITKVGDSAGSSSRLHPALLASDGGSETCNVWKILTETSQAVDMASAGPASPQRKVKAKPTAAQLEALVMQERDHFGYQPRQAHTRRSVSRMACGVPIIPQAVDSGSATSWCSASSLAGHAIVDEYGGRVVSGQAVGVVPLCVPLSQPEEPLRGTPSVQLQLSHRAMFTTSHSMQTSLPQQRPPTQPRPPPLQPPPPTWQCGPPLMAMPQLHLDPGEPDMGGVPPNILRLQIPLTDNLDGDDASFAEGLAPSSSLPSRRIPAGRARTSHASPRSKAIPLIARDDAGAPPFSADSTAVETSLRPAARRAYKPYFGKVENNIGTLGHLKPDLQSEELVAKRAAKERVKLFSKNLKTVNRQIISEQAEVAITKEPGKQQLTNREKAKQYAAQVPKPRLRPIQLTSGFDQPAKVVEEEDLLTKLERQHAEQKRQAETIRLELF